MANDDYYHGEGVDDIEDRHDYVYPDTRGGDNATFFSVNGLPDSASEQEKEHWKHLGMYNDGTHNGKWERQAVTTKLDRERRFLATVSHLQLTNYQDSETQRVFEQIDHEHIGVSHDLSTFCAAAVVVKETDGVDWRSDDRFLRLKEKQGFEENKIESRIEAVKEHVHPPYGYEDYPDWKFTKDEWIEKVESDEIDPRRETDLGWNEDQ